MVKVWVLEVCGTVTLSLFQCGNTAGPRGLAGARGRGKGGGGRGAQGELPGLSRVIWAWGGGLSTCRA